MADENKLGPVLQAVASLSLLFFGLYEFYVGKPEEGAAFVVAGAAGVGVSFKY
jgi:TM2 domain-containing membrane protein YozV